MAAPKGNKYALGNKGGRPRIITDPEELQELCDEYFEYTKGEFKIVEDFEETEDGDSKKVTRKEWIRYPEPLTVTGLALYIGFNSKSTLYEYIKKDEFSDSLKRALTKVEQGYEFRLHSDKPVGAIFALKNMNWKDRTEMAPVTPDGESLGAPIFNINVIPPKVE